ncbi:hypothetical protein HAHI6034_05640 [Hathewaya histolytica]|uniref:Uncharacterized protein n=1 Tax=Hathewaya histolytica TaxID=1498 RepID=A0A4U9RDP0_HATHI|nr:Uncharacterised protein [Hathewaya histolytica]
MNCLKLLGRILAMDKNYAELIFAILERAVMDARGLRLATEYNVDKKQVKNQAREF